jgi:hypothetical protein
MTYLEFKNSIASKLRKNSSGMTWSELKTALDLPYERPCPEWTKKLEKDIGLVRAKGQGRAFVWRAGKFRA